MAEATHTPPADAFYAICELLSSIRVLPIDLGAVMEEHHALGASRELVTLVPPTQPAALIHPPEDLKVAPAVMI